VHDELEQAPGVCASDDLVTIMRTLVALHSEAIPEDLDGFIVTDTVGRELLEVDSNSKFAGLNRFQSTTEAL
jgi:hypothetical protein